MQLLSIYIPYMLYVNVYYFHISFDNFHPPPHGLQYKCWALGAVTPQGSTSFAANSWDKRDKGWGKRLEPIPVRRCRVVYLEMI